LDRRLGRVWRRPVENDPRHALGQPGAHGIGDAGRDDAPVGADQGTPDAEALELGPEALDRARLEPDSIDELYQGHRARTFLLRALLGAAARSRKCGCGTTTRI